MDAATWLTSTDPISLLSFVRPRTPWPQRRLFVVAAWNLVRHHLTSASRVNLEFLESSEAETFNAVRQHVYDIGCSECERTLEEPWTAEDAEIYAVLLATAAVGDDDTGEADEWWRIEVQLSGDALHAWTRIAGVLCSLARCVFAFGQPAIDADRLPATVIRIAHAAHEDAAVMPVLADALEECGCGDAGALGHLRADGPHARGCWVLDKVLGKSGAASSSG
jgi:hypothetical protein